MISASASNMIRLEHQVHQVQLREPSGCQSSSSSSSRILDIPCKVCGDYSSGKHYNIFACDGCAGFFKRSIRRNRRYLCKGKVEGSCVIDKAHRNQCRACRLQKCQDVGMNKDAVQHERGPRNSTIRRAMTSFFEQQQRAALVLAGNTSEVQVMTSPGSSLANQIVPPTVPMNVPFLPTTPFVRPTPYGYFPNFPPATYQAPALISPPVTPPAPPMTPEDTCELCARLLFMNVQWTKSLPYFTSLPLEDQLLLLEDSWKDLFVLAAVQFLPIVDLTSLMEASDAFKKEDAAMFRQRVQDFEKILVQSKMTHLDAHEISCLRVMSLFGWKVSKAENYIDPRIIEKSHVELVATDAFLTFEKYLESSKPENTMRSNKLVAMLEGIRSIPTNTIEALFFEKAVGKIPIVKIISDMYRNQKS